jgi:hypothetical protein
MTSECPSVRFEFSKMSEYSRRRVLLSSWFRIYVVAELALKLVNLLQKHCPFRIVFTTEGVLIQCSRVYSSKIRSLYLRKFEGDHVIDINNEDILASTGSVVLLTILPCPQRDDGSSSGVYRDNFRDFLPKRWHVPTSRDGVCQLISMWSVFGNVYPARYGSWDVRGEGF